MSPPKQAARPEDMPPNAWSTTRILLVLTLLGLFIRILFRIGCSLGDDIGYLAYVNEILAHGYPELSPQGQYEYRPGWLLPIAFFIKIFGATPLSVTLYPIITGALIPLLASLWLGGHLPKGNMAPVYCFVILQFTPALFVDSLMLVNEMPMLAAMLACLVCFNKACASLWRLPPTKRPDLWCSIWCLASGFFFAVAYQVKVSAIPLLGFCAAAEIALNLILYKPSLKNRCICLLFYAMLFLGPTLAVQFFYYKKTGHPIGNILAETRFYLQFLPDQYATGQYNPSEILWEYPKQLFTQVGYPGYVSLLHGAWPFVMATVALAVLVFPRLLSSRDRVIFWTFNLCAFVCFLFMEFWPAKLSPYYLPNCYTGRLWRYIDFIPPLTAASLGCLLANAKATQADLGRSLKHLAFASCLAFNAYHLSIRYHEYKDRLADFDQVYQQKDCLIQSFGNKPHLIDNDGVAMLSVALGTSEKINVTGLQSNQLKSLDTGYYVWTGGARRDSLDGNAAINAEMLRFFEHPPQLLLTWPGLKRPWRHNALQLWYVPAQNEAR